MKLIFLCGCLEPGRDGVGDYTQILAKELTNQGHRIAIIALKDSYVKAGFGDFQSKIDLELPVLRLPSVWPASHRFNQAKKFIKDFEPDCLSLQYVPFSFNSKGLPFGLSLQLKKINCGKPCHIMFHELWVSLAKGSYIKSYLRLAFQKAIIRNMLGLLRPALVHTHVPEYQLGLSKLGCNAKQLPLFSNIESVTCGPEPLDSKVFRIGFFSQVEVSGPIEGFLVFMAKEVSKHGYIPEVLLIGGSELKMIPIKNQLEEISGYRNNVNYTGFLEPFELSIAIKTCSLGLTPVPRHCLGKSGSVAAFITHGIPVAAPNVHPGYSPSEIGFFSSSLRDSVVIQPEYLKIMEARKAVRRAIHDIEISRIAKNMYSDLHQTLFGSSVPVSG